MNEEHPPTSSAGHAEDAVRFMTPLGARDPFRREYLKVLTGEPEPYVIDPITYSYHAEILFQYEAVWVGYGEGTVEVF